MSEAAWPGLFGRTNQHKQLQRTFDGVWSSGAVGESSESIFCVHLRRYAVRLIMLALSKRTNTHIHRDIKISSSLRLSSKSRNNETCKPMLTRVRGLVNTIMTHPVIITRRSTAASTIIFPHSCMLRFGDFPGLISTDLVIVLAYSLRTTFRTFLCNRLMGLLHKRA